MKVRVKSGECPSYLTVGKVYEVVGIGADSIVNDMKTWIPIDISNCKHPNGGSWEVVDD